jgi:hypothetical protein
VVRVKSEKAKILIRKLMKINFFLKSRNFQPQAFLDMIWEGLKISSDKERK